MRIITGEYKGRKLETPVGYDVRPTTDKVKEAIFNLAMQDIWDSVCVDLFAGTGNLGLEALSRGARRCYFCDNARESINLIKTNIKKCRAEEQSVVLAGDYTKTLSRIREKADIFFLDPPYKDGLYEKCLEMIDSLDLLNEDGIIIAEHGARDPMPQQVGRLVRVKERTYGRIMVSIYTLQQEQQPEDEQA
ncbi:MAG: 16S rRNA (guanine(966)-N(2))-methyltransferase RsmD [Emergencia sp.]|nr:16S rRNA (guanine(966)-N(2))-methyltransferase RsmD [Emergencia sp.]